MPEDITMDVAIPSGPIFGVDVESRTIRGLAVPYGVEGTNQGRRWMFSKGTVRPRGGMTVKLWGIHEKAQAFGKVTEWDDQDDGLHVAFSVARGADGDRALTMAEDGVWDSLSIGPSPEAKFQLRDGVYHSVDVPIHEISLTPAPVFSGARVHSVTFDTDNKESTVTDTATEEQIEAPPAFDFSGITEAIQAGFSQMEFPQREVIPAGGVQLEVNEPSPYRFDGLAGEHCFTEDIRAGYLSHDGEARQRVERFIDEAWTFAVSTSNVSTLNPTQNRPDLYVPNLTFTRPLWELVTTGGLSDKTPFTVPKFASASGLVGDHTEGVEPTPGAFAATSQTVSPAPLSGKIEINREVWDQGGSPQADGIIWGEMLNGWFEAIEAKIAARLATTATGELNLAGAVDSALVDAMTAYYAGLQFVRGGNRFTATAADQKLFTALIGAKDGSGRKLLPIIGPANAQGTTDSNFGGVALGTQNVRAAWALGQGTNTRSYSFVPSSVWAWASAPKKFTFEYQVKSIDMAIWGYFGSAILRDADVKPIDYDTSDA